MPMSRSAISLRVQLLQTSFTASSPAPKVLTQDAAKGITLVSGYLVLGAIFAIDIHPPQTRQSESFCSGYSLDGRTLCIASGNSAMQPEKICLRNCCAPSCCINGATLPLLSSPPHPTQKQPFRRNKRQPAGCPCVAIKTPMHANFQERRRERVQHSLQGRKKYGRTG